MSKSFYLPIALLFLFASCSNAQYSKLDQLLPQYMEESDVPGMSIAVIDQGQVVYEKSFGLRSSDGNEKITNATIFEAASLSKPLFAFLVMQMVEEGKLNLDKPLHEYLDFTDLKHDPRYQKITARMVLSHTSGLPNWRRGKLEFRYEPGKQFGYSGEGFVYLQKVVEHITGQELESLIQERVLQPLGMTRSSYIWQTSFEDNYALPHNELKSSRSKRKPDHANAAASLHTTAPDYARFLLSLLNRKDLQASTINAMLTQNVQTPSHGNPDELSESVGWGLGWGLQQTKQGKAFWHWGDNGPFKAFVMAYPEQKKAMVFFANSTHGLSFVEDLAQEIFGEACPACRWIDYPYYRNETFGLFRKITEKGVEKAMAPFIVEGDDGDLHRNLENISEGQMNRLGYQLMRAKYFEEAKTIFQMNVLAFPTSSNVYDSYAEICLRTGDTKQAIENYQKAWMRDSGNRTAKAIIDQLNGEAKGNTSFEFEGYSNARHVALAGDFNGWNDLTHPFQWKNGKWTCSAQLEPGEYEYKFVVDGVWILDPANERMTSDKNRNSIIKVE